MIDPQPVRSEFVTALLGPEVIALECAPSLTAVRALYPEEQKWVKGAVDKRRSEFAAARVLARRALEELGVTAQPLCPNKDGSPRWPEGIVGSLTHTHEYCAVAVAPAARIASIGLDAEGGKPLKEHVIESICTDSEIRWLEKEAPEDRGHLAKLVFSAKEAFYKCQYPLTRTYLDFQDVELRLDQTNQQFRVSVLRGLAAQHRCVCEARGAYDATPERIVTAMRLDRAPESAR